MGVSRMMACAAALDGPRGDELGDAAVLFWVSGLIKLRARTPPNESKCA